MRKGFHASRIFTGDEWLNETVVVVNEGIIEKVLSKDLVEDIELRSFPDSLLVPAFIDLQVYGAAKRLLAVYPESSTLQLMYEEFSKKGTALFLPTAATNTIGVFKKCIDAVREYW